MTIFLLQKYAFCNYPQNFHKRKIALHALSGFLCVRRQILLSPSYFSLSPWKFSLSYKIGKKYQAESKKYLGEKKKYLRDGRGAHGHGLLSRPRRRP